MIKLHNLSNISSKKIFYGFMICLISFLFSFYIFRNNFYGIDIHDWINDSDIFTNCIAGLNFSCTALSRFPVGYLINSYILNFFKLAGLNEDLSMTAINYLAALLPITYLFLTKKIDDFYKLSSIYILVISTSSYLPYYLFSGALEGQIAILIGMLFSIFISMYLNHDQYYEKINSQFLLLFLFLAPLMKDTLLPLLILTGLLYLCFRYFYKIDTLTLSPYNLKILFYGAICLFLGTAIQIVYNFIKYNSALPHDYLALNAVTSPSASISAGFLFWSLFSPNGGVIAFWALSYFVLFVTLSIAGFKVRVCAIVLSFIFFTLSILGLSRWFGPFGWDCWGNRLILPACLAPLITLILTSYENNSDPIENLRKSSIIFSFKGSKFKFIFNIMAVIFISYSAYYTIKFYLSSSKYDLVNNSLHSIPTCKTMDNEFKIYTGSISFFLTDHYYNCVFDRFKYIP